MATSQQRSQLLDILSEVKTKVQDRLGDAKDFPLPQFIIVGSQSSGKSRLIESFAGHTFNFVSSSLGSRRPTVLEFRNRTDIKEHVWYVQMPDEHQWNQYDLKSVQQRVGMAHDQLGKSVSHTPVNVRLEGPYVPDMQIVDLPGFRDYSASDDAAKLADDIAKLDEAFMEEKNNVIICIEQAGDAANMATLHRVKKFDPTLKRTILVRGKLDKFYDDLHPDNVNSWVTGFGDIPEHLLPKTFALSLPHWDERTSPEPPEPFGKMLQSQDTRDVESLRQKNVSGKYLKQIGFRNFASFMEGEIERQFASAVQPVIKRLAQLEEDYEKRKSHLEDSVNFTEPKAVKAMVRDVGISFGHALNHVLDGLVASKTGRMSLEEELHQFHEYHKSRGTWASDGMLPSADFSSLEEYLEYFRDDLRCTVYDYKLNGGAQFRRLMWESEIFVRYAEICDEVNKRDIVQARGVAITTVGWRDVVVKILAKEAHLKMKARVRYVAERLRWFFKEQKEAVIEFMDSVKGSADEKMYSVLFTKHVEQLKQDPMVKEVVFETFDKVVDRQYEEFMALFENTLCATFNNPWLFMKRRVLSIDDQSLEETYLPTFEDLKERIETEMQSGADVEQMINGWVANVPEDLHEVDEAVDKVTGIIIATFKHIRSQIADQAGLFGESFFKLPMMRRLEEDMCRIELQDHHLEVYVKQQQEHEEDLAKVNDALKDVKACLEKLRTFQASKGSRLRS